MLLKCLNKECNNEWNYTGSKTVTATCPDCRRLVKITKTPKLVVMNTKTIADPSVVKEVVKELVEEEVDDKYIDKIEKIVDNHASNNDKITEGVKDE